MGNRGQKRTETGKELPADKRACCSSMQTQHNSPNSTPRADVDTSSSASASSRSDGEHEKEEDSAYGSCDSDDMEQQPHRILRDYQRRRSSSDHGKLKNILSNLNEEGNGGSGQLAALTELCEVLSFCNEDSLSSLMADSLSPILVKLAKNNDNANIILLAIRGITYLCDVFPRSSGFLVRHEAVPALCQRLLAVEYVDVAEQCLQALEKISRDQPLACLKAGAIMAVLNFIDFFSISVQRVALSTVVNICKKLPSEGPAPFVEAIPKLCDLLHHEDQQLVESVATCLIKISERMFESSEMLEELCKHELINQVTHLMNLNSRTTISQPIYNGLIGLLVKLSSGSFVAFRRLYELNISSPLKDVLSTYDLSHGMSSSHLVDGNCNQVHEVLKLLNELLPTLAGGHGNQVVLDKESFLADHPDLLQKFGMDILPTLVQVVNSGASIYVCYGCLSVISKLLFLSKSDMLVELLKTANIPSFLAGVFTRKDHHLLMLALQIAEMILQKLSDVFLNSFIKEGVFFAIDALLMTEKCSQVILPVFSGVQPSFDSSQKSSAMEVQRCLCYAFDTVPCSSVLPCKLDKDTVHNLAKHIKTNYFAPELFDSDNGMTDILQNLKTFSAALSNLIIMPLTDETPAQHEEKFNSILHQIMLKLNGGESVSTFEFIESGIVKSLMHFLSNGLYLRDNVEFTGIYDHLLVLRKRFEVFAKLFLSYSDVPVEDLPLSVLIQKLQSALSSLENFPVILSHGFKQKNSFATVPNGRCVMYPCFRVHFVMGEGETCLSDFPEDVLTVDPFSSSDAIEGYLWPKIFAKRTENGESDAEALEQMESQPILLTSNANSSQGESSGFVDRMSTDLPEMQEDEANLSQFASEQLHFKESNSGEIMSLDETDMGCAVQEQQCHSDATAKMKTQCPASSDNDIEDSSSRLLLYLEGHELDRTLTLYQVILQQLLNSENEFITWANLWSRVYTITYKIAVESKQDDPQENKYLELKSSSNKIIAYRQNMAFFSSMFACKLATGLDKSSPIYDILFLLKSLEGINKCSFHLMSCERIRAFAEGRIDNLNNLKAMVHSVPQNEFVSSRLTEKLEQQMRDTFTLSTGGMPSWCNELIASCPFLFSFEARCKYFRLAAFGPRRVQHHALSRSNSGASNDRQPTAGGLPRKKFLVWRDQILDCATRMMDQHASHKGLLEVEYNEEVGTGLGPTLEFYTLVSLEFQKSGLGMWREDHTSSITSNTLLAADSGILRNDFGLFPCPWSRTSDSYNGIQFSEVLKKFVLLGQIVAKAIQDGRVLDVPFSKAFYKLILGQDLNLYDIQSFDPELGRTLLEFHAIVNRKNHLEFVCGENSTLKLDLCFQNTRIEDLCLDFTLPGYPGYVLSSEYNHKMVNLTNLEDYIELVVDATIHTGIARQVEAFKSGFNQVFAIKHLHIFTEEELERLLCGECDFWAFNELLEHIKFDHGYTASSPPIINLLEIIQEFEYAQRRAFLQFVTGAPRLPPGGLASLNPKLTIVRKHSSNCADAELPSVMTCANYLKLPPYSSKERMKEKLLYAIREGQGSFHLS